MSYLKTSCFQKFYLKHQRCNCAILLATAEALLATEFGTILQTLRGEPLGARFAMPGLACGVWMDGTACPGAAQASGCFAGLCLLSLVSATALRGICQLQAQKDVRNTTTQMSHR